MVTCLCQVYGYELHLPFVNIPSLEASQSSLLSSPSRSGPPGPPLPTHLCPLFLTPKEVCGCTASNPRRLGTHTHAGHAHASGFLSSQSPELIVPLQTQDVSSTQARSLGTKPQVKNSMGWNIFWKQKSRWPPCDRRTRQEQRADEQAVRQVFPMERCAWLPERHCPVSAG